MSDDLRKRAEAALARAEKATPNITFAAQHCVGTLFDIARDDVPFLARECIRFIDENERLRGGAVGSNIPPGVYRVIDGELCRVVPGVPPELCECVALRQQLAEAQECAKYLQQDNDALHEIGSKFDPALSIAFRDYALRMLPLRNAKDER